ncbi:hypothetical protein C8J57DRAFT_1210286 [Mycena rebaudengoi]|nr:hypothetical protein C8J57DRAFT_1210286 [Mycena rebaudengoi]
MVISAQTLFTHKQDAHAYEERRQDCESSYMADVSCNRTGDDIGAGLVVGDNRMPGDYSSRCTKWATFSSPFADPFGGIVPGVSPRRRRRARREQEETSSWGSLDHFDWVKAPRLNATSLPLATPYIARRDWITVRSPQGVTSNVPAMAHPIHALRRHISTLPASECSTRSRAARHTRTLDRRPTEPCGDGLRRRAGLDGDGAPARDGVQRICSAYTNSLNPLKLRG